MVYIGSLLFILEDRSRPTSPTGWWIPGCASNDGARARIRPGRISRHGGPRRSRSCALVRFVRRQPALARGRRGALASSPGRDRLVVVAVYVPRSDSLDSIAWKRRRAGGNAVGVLSERSPHSMVDRAFLGHDARRATRRPFAVEEFYGGDGRFAIRARTPSVRTSSGRDVLYLSLKGARVALLIGGLTSLIAIPLALLFGVGAGYFGGRFDDVVFFLISTLASMPGLLLLIALIMVMGRGTALGLRRSRVSRAGSASVGSRARRDPEAARARLRARRRGLSVSRSRRIVRPPHPAESGPPDRDHLRA